MMIARPDNRLFNGFIRFICFIRRVRASGEFPVRRIGPELQRQGSVRVRCDRRPHGEAEQGFIGAPEYGQAGVTPLTDRFGMTAGSTTIPNGRTA